MGILCATRSSQHINIVHVWIESFICKIVLLHSLQSQWCNCIFRNNRNISFHFPTAFSMKSTGSQYLWLLTIELSLKYCLQWPAYKFSWIEGVDYTTHWYYDPWDTTVFCETCCISVSTCDRKWWASLNMFFASLGIINRHFHCCFSCSFLHKGNYKKNYFSHLMWYDLAIMDVFSINSVTTVEWLGSLLLSVKKPKHSFKLNSTVGLMCKSCQSCHVWFSRWKWQINFHYADYSIIY